jgi:hypothetical protein
VHGRDQHGAHEKLFFWMLSAWDERHHHNLPTIKTRGYRLYAAIDRVGFKYYPVVERLIDDNDSELRLFAAEDYELGEAIVFPSQY